MKNMLKSQLRHHKYIAEIPCNQKSMSTNSMSRYFEVGGSSQVGFNYMKRRCKRKGK